MVYTIWLAALLLAFFLTLAAALVFLYLHALRVMRSSYQAQAEALAKTLEIQLTLAKQAQESVQDQLTEQAEKASELTARLLTETASRLEANQQQTVRTLDLMATRTMNGLQALNEQTSQTLRSTLTMIGTKDPLAYQMVRGAEPIPDDSSLEPYTAADDVEEQQAKIRQLEETQKLLEGLGVVDDGTGFPGPHPADLTY